jgi:hypothetical protein
MRLAPLLGLVALIVPVGTSLAGPFTMKGTQPGLVHPLSASSNCTFCHGDYDSAHHIEPLPTWSGSMMAHSARDPLFWAALDVANNDQPGIGEWCLRCHAPAAWLAGRSGPPGGTADGCALQGNLDQPGSDFDGVSCHLCHRMQLNSTPPAGQQPLYFENAQYWLDDSDCNGQGEPCRHGPYDYPADGSFQPLHPWKFSAYVESSEVCAVCHNVTNPATNLRVNGVDQGIRFPIERTYREWSQSVFAPGEPEFAECQACHMPDAGVNPAYASSFGINNHAGDLPIHQFAGGNAWIPAVLASAYPSLGVGANLLAGRDFALAMLQQQSAEIAVTAPAAAAPGDTLPLTVRVTNLTGHKLPTGYPEGRRMWLHVAVRDATDAIVWESGAYDPATAVLTRDAQVKVYEAKQGVWDAGAQECVVESGGRELFHFAKNDCVVLDNRIPPKGFIGGTDLETHPVGYTYPEVAPGELAHWDDTTYSVPVPANAAPPLTVTATLRYQTTSKEYIDFLLDEATTHGFPNDCLPRSTGLPTTSRAGLLQQMWSTYDKAPPVDMVSAQASIDLISLDAFLCYKARGASAVGATAVLADPFGTGSFVIGKAGDVCEPADTGTGTVDGVTHLVAYKLKRAPGQPALPKHTGVSVADAAGGVTVDALAPGMLLVAAARGATPPLPAEHEVDDFTCWKTTVTRGTPAPAWVTIDAGGALTAPPKTFRVGKPRWLCRATARDGTPPKHAQAALLCRKAKPARGEPKHLSTAGVVLSDALGTVTLATTGDDVLCLPATIAP